MQPNYALAILQDGFQNLIGRKGSITIDDLEGEVNFQCCRYILENYGDKVVSVPDINRINDVIGANKNLFTSIISDFLRAAYQIFPNHWQVGKDGIFIHMIAANLSWSGMWDHLVTYFLKEHGEDIDDNKKESLIFYSQKHHRFEFNKFVSEAVVERNVNITFFNDGEYIMVSIEPSLSSKKAKLSSNQGQKLIYIGEDPDYRFTIELDAYDEVEKFTLELLDRSVKIEYF